MSPFEHHATSRTPRAAGILVALWLAVMALWWGINLAPWIVVLMLAPSLPAAWDYATGRSAELRLGDRLLEWRSGRAEGEVALARLAHVRFETRLDLSIRVRLVLDSGRRISLPQDCVPPKDVLQEALEARGIRTVRHHFALLS